MVNSTVILTFVVTVVAAPVLTAQQATVPQPSQAPSSAEQLRNQVRVFETTLRAAIERAATTFGSRVREAIPTFTFDLAFADEPMVTGVVIPDIGTVFHVQIPALSPVDTSIINAGSRLSRVSPEPDRGTPVSLSGGSAREATAGVVFEPNREYTNLTRDALIDAVLDNALSVPIPVGQTLTVFAGELIPGPSNPLAQRSRLLILTIKGEDLLALRENRISRDEAKTRIKESRFG